MTGARPNVLLVVMDTARADAFEPYGAPRGSSPTVADMAASGRAHEMFAPACWTIPSHASLFSGLLSRSAGFGAPARTHADFKAAGDRIADRWLPSVLRTQGYETHGVSANVWISKFSGFDRGFDEFNSITGARAIHIASSSTKDRLAWAVQALRARVDDGATAVEEMVRGWAGSRSRQPFFWFVNLVECHSPYLPPKPYNQLGGFARIKAAREAQRYLNTDAIWKGLCGGTEAPRSAIARMRSLYAASIALMDDWLARVLGTLDRAGVLDETIVIVTSDHGENLGENDLIGHGFSLDNRLLKVPFVYRGPAAELPSPIASLVDVPAWLAASLGLREHPWGEVPSDRRAVVAQFDGPVERDDQRAREAIDTWGLGQEALSRLTTSFVCATDGRVKLLRRGDGDALVDLEADPLERAPVPVDHEPGSPFRAQLGPLRAALDEAAAAAVPGVLGTDDEVPASSEEQERLEAQLKLLGYL